VQADLLSKATGRSQCTRRRKKRSEAEKEAEHGHGPGMGVTIHAEHFADENSGIA
jgi:hypothetical protein